MKNLIDARNLVKIYQSGTEELRALDNVSLKVEKGEFLAVLGPSGSGKSTLMNVLGCLDLPTSGEYFLDGVNVIESNEDYLADIRNNKIGFVFQKFNLLPRLTALQNVMLPLFYRGMEEEEAVETARQKLAVLRLEDRMYHFPNQLSGGQQQRVAIARALVGNPPLILADEPTGNLDSKSGEDVMEIFSELNKQGNTVVLITHDRDIAKRLKRVVYIKDGKIYDDK